MCHLHIGDYKTDNRIGATQIIQDYHAPNGGYEFEKGEVSLEDLFDGDNFYADQIKLEYEEVLKTLDESEEDFTFADYQQVALDTHAFEYNSIKDQQLNKEFWVSIAALAVIITATIIFPPAGLTLGAIYGTYELTNAVRGKDLISGRELGTGERWFRGLLAPLDIVPGLGTAKKFVTTGKVTSKVASFSKIGLKSADLAKVRQSIGNTVQTAGTTGLNRIKQAKQIFVDKIKQDIDQFKQIGSSAMNKIDEGAANFVNLLRGEEMAVAGIGSIGKIDSGVMNTAKNVDSGVMFSKSTGNVANKGGGIEYKNYKAVEYTGTTKVSGEVRDTSRRVYQRLDIDYKRIDVDTGLSNYQLMKKGRAPIWKDGTVIELHHLIQKEPGTMVELPSSLHKAYHKILHGLVENGGSFRNNPVLNKQYDNFRSKLEMASQANR